MTTRHNQTVKIAWDRGQADVQTLGAMLGPFEGILDNGRVVQPFTIAPWGDDDGTDHDALPGILKRLRGEWPCVPFGAPSAPDGLPERWQSPTANPVDPEFHGLPANTFWQITDTTRSSVTLRFDYPAQHSLAYLERTITGVCGRAELEITLTIAAREPVSTTLALHPVFALPSIAGSARLEIPFRAARTFPMPVEAGVSVLSPDTSFETLTAAPTHSGVLDLSRLPLAQDTEELVQLIGVEGRAILEVPTDGYRVTLDFDPAVFPSVMLWISNRGRAYYPWNGRFTALGIEPVRGAFDLGPDVGAWTDNPLAADGTPTCLDLKAGERVSTQYRIAVESI